MSDINWMLAATRFTFSDGIPPNRRRTTDDFPINIERCDQMDGVTQLWAVRQAGNCLHVEGFWDWEPTPSSRNEYWIPNHRFTSKEAAYAAMLTRKAAD